jgi:rhomboid protease GluP
LSSDTTFALVGTTSKVKYLKYRHLRTSLAAAAGTQAGRFIERLFGSTGFLLVYIISGIAGALVSVAWHPYVIGAGASGAIFGLYGALLGYLAMRRDSIPDEVLSPLIKGALVFIGYNFVFGVLNTGTDVADHVGGLAAGFV